VKNRIITTEDGSHTIYNEQLNEIYHSKFGAVAESMHVYIDYGFKPAMRNFNTLKILEIGFGTGLNTFLTFLENRQWKNRIEYTALEPYPISPLVYKQLNYPEVLPDKQYRNLFLMLHEMAFYEKVDIDSEFSLFKSGDKIEKADLPYNTYHLVYFDAFAPDVQPELWTSEIFKKIYKSMQKNGLLLTYSSRGWVKRNMQEAGFGIEKLPGPRGKREIIRAIK